MSHHPYEELYPVCERCGSYELSPVAHDASIYKCDYCGWYCALEDEDDSQDTQPKRQFDDGEY